MLSLSLQILLCNFPEKLFVFGEWRSCIVISSSKFRYREFGQLSISSDKFTSACMCCFSTVGPQFSLVDENLGTFFRISVVDVRPIASLSLVLRSVIETLSVLRDPFRVLLLWRRSEENNKLNFIGNVRLVGAQGAVSIRAKDTRAQQYSLKYYCRLKISHKYRHASVECSGATTCCAAGADSVHAHPFKRKTFFC